MLMFILYDAGIGNADVMFTAPVGSTHIFVQEEVADRNMIGN